MLIVDQIKQDAVRAAEYTPAVNDLERHCRLGRVTDIVSALEDRFEENGAAFLKSIGITCELKGSSLLLRKSGWAFVIAPHDNMTLSVNSAIIRPDPNFPLLTDALYRQIATAIVLWAQKIDDGVTGRPGL